jgi:dTDP-4-dehydrorhamnose reductase
MTKKILIFGNGQLGNFYLRYFAENGYTAEIGLVDINNEAQVEKEIQRFRPDVLINTAAKTNLEWCADNQLETFKINVLGTDTVAKICDKHDVYFVHLSSGCILESKDENDAKDETALPAPISYYSWTKVWGENLIPFKKSNNFRYLILRPRQPVSSQVSYKNMLIKMLTFTRFIDVPNNGTVIEDLMVWTEKLINKGVVGVVHVANEGWTTPYQIGLLLKKYILPDMPVIKITKEELNKLTPEKRVDTILDVSKLKKLVGEVKPYRKRIKEIIVQLGENLKTVDRVRLQEELNKTVAQSKTRTIVNEVWPQLLASRQKS